MRIKVINNDAAQFIGKEVCYRDIPTTIDDFYENEVKEKVVEGYDIKILENDDWVDGKKYFDNDNDKKNDYSKLFEGHWKHQVQKVEEYSNDPEVISEILNYAKENDISNGVIKRVKKYLSELE